MPGSPDDRDAWMTFLVERCDDLLQEVRRTADALAVPVGEAGDRAEVLRIWGGLSTALLNATTAARLLGQAHPDAVVRERADAAEQQATALAHEVRLDRGVYETLAALDTDGLDEATARMLRMTLRDFRRSGVDLDDQTRTRLRELAERDTALAQTFERTRQLRRAHGAGAAGPARRTAPRLRRLAPARPGRDGRAHHRLPRRAAVP